MVLLLLAFEPSGLRPGGELSLEVSAAAHPPEQNRENVKWIAFEQTDQRFPNQIGFDQRAIEIDAQRQNVLGFSCSGRVQNFISFQYAFCQAVSSMRNWRQRNRCAGLS